MLNCFSRLLLYSLVFVFSVSITAQNNLCQSSKMMQAPIYYSPENLRSDTFNILKYTINLEVGNLFNKFIAGNTQVKFVPKMNAQNFIRLDLLKLIVDSIREITLVSTLTLTSTYNDTILKINFQTAKNIADTSTIAVYYHGLPQMDATGWGGFYFNNTQGAQYAYNLGVGFGANPHNYGRIWFPCFDNFVERSKYEFNITSDTARRATCNGMLISDVISNNKRTRKWGLNQEIPTYLACVTVANYQVVNWNINVMNGNIPITLTAFASDTSNMKAGFVNLKSCILGFENFYGPYMWPRFGYYLMPFAGGAMEHATNIAYPRNAIGNLANEDLMSHELSHHWWGDLVTCETQEDMWINEGMASFSAFLFFEWQYGKPNYLTRIKEQHDGLLQFLHLYEGGFRAVSGVPHSLTYSDHVYRKGSDITHTLRGYLGDSAFFAGLKYTLQQKAFQSMNSNEFKILMQTGSGQNVNDFFTNWVFTGGWSHFSLDSVKYSQAGPSTYQAVISLKQKTFGTTVLHNTVPLEITFFNTNWSSVIRKVVMSGAVGNFTTSLPFNPVYAALNYEDKISDATSHESKVIKITGTNDYQLGKLTFTITNAGQDSSLLRVIHNYVKPDAFKSNPLNHRLSDQHYWKVEGILSPGFVSKARFNYNGTKTTGGVFGYMDTLLTAINGDSVSLFYRINAADDWQLQKKVSKVKSSTKTGYVDVDTLKLGEYCFGNSTDLAYLGIKKTENKQTRIKIYPNPANHNCTVELEETNPWETYLSIYTLEGKLIQQQKLVNKINQVDISKLEKGTYLFEVQPQNAKAYEQKLLIE